MTINSHTLECPCEDCLDYNRRRIERQIATNIAAGRPRWYGLTIDEQMEDHVANGGTTD